MMHLKVFQVNSFTSSPKINQILKSLITTMAPFMPDDSIKKKVISMFNELKVEIKTQFTYLQNDYNKLKENTQQENYQYITLIMAITQNN